MFCLSASGIYKVGDKPKDVCWTALEQPSGIEACLHQSSDNGYVNVLLFNTGWCGPCNQEFKELVPETNAFASKKVNFTSLSAEGWGPTSRPDMKFLEEWSVKHGIGASKAYWITAASFRNAGRDYFDSPRIPNVVIIDRSGRVFWKAISPGAKEIVRKVEAALK